MRTASDENAEPARTLASRNAARRPAAAQAAKLNQIGELARADGETCMSTAALTRWTCEIARAAPIAAVMVLNGIPQLYGLDGPARPLASTIDYVAQGTAIGHELGKATGAPSGAAVPT